MPRSTFLAALVLAALAFAGCSLSNSSRVTSGKAGPAGVGFPISATKNTTRVPGSDPVDDAAGTATAVFPSTTPETRPATVVLVDKGDWQGGLAASALVASPASAAILLSDGSSLPTVSAEALALLRPKGSGLPGRVKIVRIGSAPAPSGYSNVVISGGDPYTEAAAIDHFDSVARGRPSGDVIVASGEQPAYAMPAAEWAARSGDAVLFATSNSLPAPTRAALVEHQHPNIYILGPTSVIGTSVEHELDRLGQVKRVAGPDPVQNAIAFTRYKDGNFGFGAVVPGQNLTVANTTRPLDAAAAAVLGANGIFAPLLLTDRADQLPTSLAGYFLDVQPGYQNNDPSQGVFNHVWIMGGTNVLSAAAQDEIDADTALVPVDQTAGP